MIGKPCKCRICRKKRKFRRLAMKHYNRSILRRALEVLDYELYLTKEKKEG
jgi:hypothetical protein